MKMISSDLTPDLKSPEDYEQARQLQDGRIAAISWLGLGRKPSGQIVARLKSKGFSDSVIQAVLISLGDDGYIDDESLILRQLKQRQGRHAESRRALVQRMQRLGLPESAIDNVFPDDWSDQDAACQLLDNRFGPQILKISEGHSGNNASEISQRELANLLNKAGRFLSGRGFSQDVIYRALRKYLSRLDIREDDQA